jgi:acyl-coenzyme A thioesterase PaaI-like protein
MHAGVLFTAAEAAAGLAVTQHRDLAALTLLATRVTIDYQRPARGDVQALAAVTEEDLRAIREGMAHDPRHDFEVTVDLTSEGGGLLAQCVCTFQLRAPR